MGQACLESSEEACLESALDRQTERLVEAPSRSLKIHSRQICQFGI